MGSSGRPTQRRYTVEQKEQAIRLVRQLRAETGQKHGAVQRVAAQLDYGVEPVRAWVAQADIDRGVAQGVMTQDSWAYPRAGARDSRVAPGERHFA